MTPERQRVVDLLRAEIDLRQRKNPAYSLRAFARDLETPAAVMSLVLQGKRPLTAEKALQWSELLKLSGAKKSELLAAVSREVGVRLDPVHRKTRAIEEKMDYFKLQMDQFALLSDWWHFGLMNLVKLKDCPQSPPEMARRLGIRTEDCIEALERLERLGLMSKSADRWVRTERPVETPTDIPSEAIRSFHRQNIRRALDSIEKHAVEDRDVTSIMVATSKDRLEEAKRRIRLFRKELAAFLEEAEPEVIYSLNVQLFPQSEEGP